MNPDAVDRLEDGEARDDLKKVKEDLTKEDDLLNQLGEHIQQAEKKRKQTFDPST
jgi:hypothetical protein